MTTITEAIVLACPVCTTTHELDPYTYRERPCRRCGTPLVLAGGWREVTTFVWWFWTVHRPCCGTVFRPETRAFTDELARCPPTAARCRRASSGAARSRLFQPWNAAPVRGQSWRRHLRDATRMSVLDSPCSATYCPWSRGLLEAKMPAAGSDKEEPWQC
jgi:hypothetical protein